MARREEAPARFSACKLSNLKRIFQRAPYPVEMDGDRARRKSLLKGSCIVLDQQLTPYLR